jgi:ABC-2 type transport system permease protein
MQFKRLWAVFMARNREFFRDREAFGWNFLFPFLIILGFGVIFKGDYASPFKVGVFPVSHGVSAARSIDNPSRFVCLLQGHLPGGVRHPESGHG